MVSDKHPRSIAPVSVHGGHSGQFCLHASNTLEEIVEEYHNQKFCWVGLTEHVPPAKDELRYLDEIEAGLDRRAMETRFEEYMAEARRLQEQYRQHLPLLVGMEIETCSGCLEYAAGLRERLQPDYIVGSVHFVDDICFDYSQEEYHRASRAAGGLDQLYCRYFDLQFEMLEYLQPEVVGHFDLVRLYDPNYPGRLRQPEIAQRIRRNLELIKDLDLILDFNLRALFKGGSEPYISRPILKLARRMDIRVAPGDDSHSVHSVGCHMDRGISILQAHGFPCDWEEWELPGGPCPPAKIAER